MTRLLAALLALPAAVAPAAAQLNRPQAPAPRATAPGDEPFVQIAIPPLTEGGPTWSGRVIVYLNREGSSIPPRLGASDGPFFEDPQPMFSMRVENAKAGDTFRFKDEVAFPVPLKDLPPGRYQAMAVFDVENSHTSWQKEEGSLNSPYTFFEIGPGKEAPFLQFVLAPSSVQPIPNIPGVERFQVKSDLLSAFRGEEVTVDVGVVFPVNHDPSKQYPAVYWVSGFPSTFEFGGDFRDAWIEAAARNRRQRPTHELWSNAFIISVDTQGRFGHHLHADSDVNGPVGKALVQEIIPALEAKYGLISRPEARALRGHSSGGWSSVWLATNYPETFGAAWSSSPDPVDFRAFQLVNLYEQDNLFAGRDGKDLPSYSRKDGTALMTIRQELAMERVLGPDADSGQQWSSWQAVFGARTPAGAPAPIADHATGRISPDAVKAWSRYDIGARLRDNPRVVGPIFRDRVRLIVGDKDNFNLDGAVRLLAEDLKRLDMLGQRSAGGGYVEIVPDADHGDILSPDRQAAIWEEILAHFRKHGVTP